MAATRRCSCCVLSHTGPRHLDVPPRGCGPCLFGLTLARQPNQPRRKAERRGTYHYPNGNRLRGLGPAHRSAFLTCGAHQLLPSIGPLPVTATNCGDRVSGQSTSTLPLPSGGGLAPCSVPAATAMAARASTARQGPVHHKFGMHAPHRGSIPSVFNFVQASRASPRSGRGRDFLESAPKQPGCGWWTARLWLDPGESQELREPGFFGLTTWFWAQGGRTTGGGNSTLAPAGLAAKHQWNSRLEKTGGHKSSAQPCAPRRGAGGFSSTLVLLQYYYSTTIVIL